MNLPVIPPIAPMLGKLSRELPRGGYLYEPKWDGFRCLAFRDGDRLELRSRHDRPLARYFPELVIALRELESDRFVLDGELLVGADGRAGGGGYDFAALMARLHPAASRVRSLSAATPATFMAFDLLALGDADLRDRPFRDRRAELEGLLAPTDHAEDPGGRVALTPITSDPALASRWAQDFAGGGVDGVMAKPEDLPYQPGKRAMIKLKLERTLDCVVGGFRLLADRPLPSSLLLGLHDGAGVLRHIGVASSFTERLRHELLAELRPLMAPLAGHPWEDGFLVEGNPMGRLRGAAARWAPGEMELDWIPVAPVRVAEVAYDHLDLDRLRHPARFRRWRLDREAASCGFDQLAAREAAAGPVFAATS